MPIAINSITVPQDGVPVGTLSIGHCFVCKNEQDNIYMTMPQGMAFSITRRSMEQLDPHLLVYPVRIAGIAKVCRSRMGAANALTFTSEMRQGNNFFEFTAKCEAPLDMKDLMVRRYCYNELCKTVYRELAGQWGEF